MNEDVKAYLIHSYLYYKLNESVISDHEYDKLCIRLLDSGVEHPLISKEDLEAGTGYQISEYPPEIIEEANRLLKDTQATLILEQDASEAPVKLEFSGNPAETYLLLGMYISYGHSKQKDKQAEIQEELLRRWNENIHRKEFLSYFKDHDVEPERFDLPRNTK